MRDTTHPIHWVQCANQRLGLVPSLGGGVAAWQRLGHDEPFDLWRPWMGAPDLYSLASFPLVPWSNRISEGGFDFGGRFHPIAPNRTGEPYPIHGDGWLQAWTLSQTSSDTVQMQLVSDRFGGNPYQYCALQQYVLREDGMDQTLTVTHTGDRPLPYGLGQPPWFWRDANTRVQADVKSIWLSRESRMPTFNSPTFPVGWDPRFGMDASGGLIDHAYAGWSGSARITWPQHKLSVTLRLPQIQTASQPGDGVCLLYRPPQGSVFCFEPVTHPIDAFHLPGLPGLRVLQPGESLRLYIEWRFQTWL